jgi:hypothetical protein
MYFQMSFHNLIKFENQILPSFFILRSCNYISTNRIFFSTSLSYFICPPMHLWDAIWQYDFSLYLSLEIKYLPSFFILHSCNYASTSRIFFFLALLTQCVSQFIYGIGRENSQKQLINVFSITFLLGTHFHAACSSSHPTLVSHSPITSCYMESFNFIITVHHQISHALALTKIYIHPPTHHTHPSKLQMHQKSL